MATFERRKAEERRVFERIMGECERRVLRIALRLLNNPQDAQDAAQEVFLKLYKHLGRLDSTQGYEAWLFRVTVNVCHDIARRRRTSVALEEFPEPARPPEAYHDALRAEQRDVIRRGLAFLGPKERASLVLRDVEGLTTREVAEILGSSETTVRAQISTARLKLREFSRRWSRRRL